MNIQFFLLASLTITLTACNLKSNQCIQGMTPEELHYHSTSVIQYDGEQIVEIHGKHMILARVEVTTKGNGKLELFDGGVRTFSRKIYDANTTDGSCFRGTMLRYRFCGVNGKGLCELEISGEEDFYEADTDILIGRIPVYERYSYDATFRHWQQIEYGNHVCAD